MHVMAPTKIDTSIPIPSLPVPCPYGLMDKLKPGNSLLFLSGAHMGKGILQTRVCAAAAYRIGKGKYATRVVRNGVRVWRTK